MDKTIRVLVFPCGAENAVEVFHALKNVVNVEIFGASAKSDHGEYIFGNYIGNVPNIREAYFVPTFNQLLETYSIDVVIPTHDDVVLKLAEHEHELRGKVLVHGREQAQICRSKKQTYAVFKDADFCCPTFATLSEVTRFPVFVKPDQGQGGQGAFLLRNEQEASVVEVNPDQYVICEYLPGEEVTVDCFTNYRGELVFVGPRLRARVSNGISTRSFPVELTDEILGIATNINQKLKLNGLWYFQIKKAIDGRFKLLEISLRVSGTMSLFRGKGVNFPLLAVYNALNYDVEVLENSFHLEVDRALINRYKHNIAYEHVYIDFDDTITRKGRVNPDVVMALYNLINQNKKIHLITRHEHDVFATLDKLKIHRGIFDSVISVPAQESKSDYIQQRHNSIFIDNSFKERYSVLVDLGIPVFDVDAIETLIDWKS